MKKMTTKTELAQKSKEELIEEIIAQEKKLKEKTPPQSNDDGTDKIVKALRSLAVAGNAQDQSQEIDVTPQGYAVLPPIPINAMLPIQKTKWRIDNMSAIIEKGGLRAEIDRERRRKVFVLSKKFVELYEAAKKENSSIIKDDTDLLKNPDPTGKAVSFNMKGFYDGNVERINKMVMEKAAQDSKRFNMPVKKHVYK
jgi:hypothetical protein